MSNTRKLFATVVIVTCISGPAFGQDSKAPGVESGETQKDGKPSGGENARPAAKPQSDVASKTAVFGKTSKGDEICKAALDAHDLAAGSKQVDKDGAFKGTVAKVFEPRSGTLAILNFDEDYKKAMTALVRSENFDKFPDLKMLIGKDVLVTGKFMDYHGAVEIVLTNVAQIKVIE
jgi:hypothetical protein